MTFNLKVLQYIKRVIKRGHLHLGLNPKYRQNKILRTSEGDLIRQYSIVVVLVKPCHSSSIPHPEFCQEETTFS